MLPESTTSDAIQSNATIKDTGDSIHHDINQQHALEGTTVATLSSSSLLLHNQKHEQHQQHPLLQQQQQQQRQQSSEEESVVEFGYMSETSNLSIAPSSATTLVKTSTNVEMPVIDTVVAPIAPAIAQQNLLNDNRKTNRNVSNNDVDFPSSNEQIGDIDEHDDDDDDRCPKSLPKFPDVASCMWTASWAANCPTEDRSASLVNLILQPLPPNYDSETQLAPFEPNYSTLIRLNLWAVIDGHGGGCVATYSSEVLLPHIAASISRALNCAIIDRGVCMVNGQLRDANALDLDGLIKTSSDRGGNPNPNSVHYRSPYERSDSEDEDGAGEESPAVPHTVSERKQIASLLLGAKSGVASVAATECSSSNLTKKKRKQCSHNDIEVDASVSSVKTSVKTASSLVNREELVGTHSPREIAAITRAITESFLAVDEGWINSIDPVATQQTSCQSNGRWNSGACALVVFTIQRLDWTNVAEPEREKDGALGLEANRLNTSQNRDAARRRMLDRTKSASSVSTKSSTSSLTMNASGIESEITETEGEDDDDHYLDADVRRRIPINQKARISPRKKKSLINPSTKSSYCYKAHQARIYTAHVGDCRAVMLGSAPPRTIKVGGTGGILSSVSHQDTTDDEESSHHSSDETECLSSSDHDADSSEDEDIGGSAAVGVAATTGTSGGTGGAPPVTSNSSVTSTTTNSTGYVNFPRRVVRQRHGARAIEDSNGPYIALPPLEVNEESKISIDADLETEIDRRTSDNRKTASGDSSSDSQDSIDMIPLIQLPPGTSPIDLTTDHSAYNPAEVAAVLRRCNNAPRAISAGVGGGIKRVAGSLAVTRALGDAYLKSPLLSFLPYKSHAPYISARPEVNCRPLVNDGDKVLILATDGVWERGSGEDVLRWVRNFYEERIAEAERRKRRRLKHASNSTNNNIDNSDDSNDDDDDDSFEPVPMNKNFQQEGSERDLFEKNEEIVPSASPNLRKRSTTATTTGGPAKRRKRKYHHRRHDGMNRSSGVTYNVADVIIRRILNKVRRSRNISSLQALMSLPQGRARRSKHDDITACVVDLSAFVS